MKKLIPIVLLISAFALLLTACGSEATGGSDRPLLIMATSADFPPFEFINEDGEYDGFDVHMARALADILDMELRIDNMDFNGIIATIATGQADIGVAAISITEERLESVHFTVPYFETTQVVIVQNASPIQTPAELFAMGADANIAVQVGTTSATVASFYLPDAQRHEFNMATALVMELNTGRVDAIVIDHAVANEFIADQPNFRILEDYLGIEEYAIAVAFGNEELLEQLNQAIQQWLGSDDHTRIYNMFFGGN
ncbi:MAG: transporter substrate-binding domain-containing protein [Defluviitaleaceae bacterium]|nr:transporter substrate-binding domain-containing protein [Defluviitaleaceae bacterium]